MNFWIFLPILLWKVITAHQQGCGTSEYYNVTDRGMYIDLRPDFDDPDSENNRNQNRCMLISTARYDEVVKIEEMSFHLDGSKDCNQDSLTLYDSRDFSNLIGVYCGCNGPETQYASGQHMLLHLVTGSSIQRREFHLYTTGTHKEDVPEDPEEELSGLAIFGIIAACVFVVVIVASAIFYFKNRKSSERSNGTVEPSSNHLPAVSNQPYGQSNGASIPMASLGNSNSFSQTLQPPSYIEVTRNSESKSALAHGGYNPAPVANGESTRSPPSYEELVQRNAFNGEVQTDNTADGVQGAGIGVRYMTK